MLKHFFPFLQWLPELKKGATLRADIIAGLTVAMLIIPQSMAYAHLAGLPVYIGLYAAFIPPLITVLFGSSRYLSTGPVPVTSLLTAVTMLSLAVSGSKEYLQYVMLLTLVVGLIQMALGLLRFGVVVHFLSYPVMIGFINGIAIIIASMQLSGLFGVSAITAPHYYETVWQVLTDATTGVHWPSVAMASMAFFLIWGGRKVWPRLPHILIAVIVTTTLAWYFNYEETEIINLEQISSFPVQQLLHHKLQYSQEMGLILQRIHQAEQKVRQVRRQSPHNIVAIDKAVHQLNQAKWLLEERTKLQQIEEGQLSRIRLRRIQASQQAMFLVDDDKTPEADADTRVWRIVESPTTNQQLTLHSGGAIIGSIPQGLPAFKPVVWDWNRVSRFFMAALVIALVGFTEAITIAKHIATRSRQRIHINQELLSQGLAKCIGSFFQCMPVSGSFTRTTLNFEAGAKTGFSTFITSVAVMTVLLWFTSLFYYLPYATLAAIILIGMIGLIDLKEMRHIWRVNRREGMVSWFTLLLTLFLAPNIAHALILGMLLSLGVYLYETMRPRFYEMVRQREGVWVEASQQEPGSNFISLVRFGGSLYFANASYFEEKVLQLIHAKQQLNYILLDCIGVNKLDASGLQTLFSLCDRLKDLGIELWFTRVPPAVWILLERGGLVAKLGPQHFYKNNEEAYTHALSALRARKKIRQTFAKHINT